MFIPQFDLVVTAKIPSAGAIIETWPSTNLSDCHRKCYNVRSIFPFLTLQLAACHSFVRDSATSTCYLGYLPYVEWNGADAKQTVSATHLWWTRRDDSVGVAAANVHYLRQGTNLIPAPAFRLGTFANVRYAHDCADRCRSACWAVAHSNVTQTCHLSAQSITNSTFGVVAVAAADASFMWYDRLVDR